jgi:hypothetical protein
LWLRSETTRDSVDFRVCSASGTTLHERRDIARRVDNSQNENSVCGWTIEHNIRVNEKATDAFSGFGKQRTHFRLTGIDVGLQFERICESLGSSDIAYHEIVEDGNEVLMRVTESASVC